MPHTPSPVRLSTELPEGTVALVTGGGSGIGRGIAEAFADAGAAVAVSGRRREVLDDVVAAITERGGRAVAVAGDVARVEDAAAMVEATVRELGDLHVLVNNAGIARGGPLDEQSPEDIEAMIDIDFKGPIWMLRAALPALRRHHDASNWDGGGGDGGDDGGGAVINISSSVTRNVVPNFSVYSAAKAGLDTLTRCWARDLAADRIRVNAILPGVVETPIFQTMMPAAAVERALGRFAEETPLGRVGRPADVAALALYLASPASAWMTGALLTLDGGISLAS